MALGLQLASAAMFPKRALLFAATVSLAALPILGATRLTYTMGDKVQPVYWASFPVSYQVDSRVANSLPGGVETVDRAFNTWANVPDSNISFRDLGVVDGARAGCDGKNTVSLADDLFKNQQAIAMTTNWYDNDGKLTEADIQIDTSMVSSDYNIQQALTHEVGHFLGLDHSAVISAIMFPYVSRGGDAPVLDSDDRIAISNMYPKADPTMIGGVLKGRVIDSGSGVFAAQVVAVNENGVPVATALTSATGDFTLQAIPNGNYRIYAEPLDGPVDVRNLAGVWRSATVKSFPTEFLSGGTLRVDNGKVYGNLIVDTSGAPTQLNPRWIGVAAPGSQSFNLTSTAAVIKPGQSISIAVAGDGFTSGMTTFAVLNPGFKRTSDFKYAGNYVYATFVVSPDAPTGSAVVLVDSGNQEAALTGALKLLVPPARMRLARR